MASPRSDVHVVVVVVEPPLPAVGGLRQRAEQPALPVRGDLAEQLQPLPVDDRLCWTIRPPRRVALGSRGRPGGAVGCRGAGEEEEHGDQGALSRSMNSQSVFWSGELLQVSSTQVLSGQEWSRLTDHMESMPIPLSAANAASWSASER